MPSKVTKWGNSLGVRIPKILAERAGLGEGALVDLCIEDGRIVIRSVDEAYELRDLLSRISEENIHKEIATGESVGREAW